MRSPSRCVDASRSTTLRRAAPLALALVVGSTASAAAQQGSAARVRPGTTAAAPDSIEDVVIHPIVSADVSCTEHPYIPVDRLVIGDVLGADCIVYRADRQSAHRRPPRYYAHNGSKNADWFGWGATLLAPFDGTVDEIHINPVTNVPGTPGKGPASYIVFRRADGTCVMYAHVQHVRVKEGDRVTAGEPVAEVGNNGFAYMPHTHIGAWRGTEPLQIRFDLKALGRDYMARNTPAR